MMHPTTFAKFFLRSNCVSHKLCCRFNETQAAPNARLGIVSEDNLDEEYYLNPVNFEEIHTNIKLRRMTELDEQLKLCFKNKDKIKEVLRKNLSKLPNKLYSNWMNTDLNSHDSPPMMEPNFEPPEGKLSTEKLLAKRGLILGNKFSLSHAGSPHCYTLTGDVARLERALLSWTRDQLVHKFKFTPVVVPNLLYDDVIRGCGFEPRGLRSQVYSIKGDAAINSQSQVCLSGTSEIPLVALQLGQTIDAETLPRKICAVSRCYRAEVGSGSGLYRVHYFNKVEMVAVTRKEDSQSVLQEFVGIQTYLFEKLGLKFRVRDMPPHDLGLPAHRKFDIEAFFPVSGIWGEISSASDCTDFQTRRFNIKYREFTPEAEDGELIHDVFASTVNGTAVASPRILLPLIEGGQENRGYVKIPEVLVSRMGGQRYLANKKS